MSLGTIAHRVLARRSATAALPGLAARAAVFESQSHHHIARCMSSSRGSESEPGFNPETPHQRMLWMGSLVGVGAAAAYFLFRVYTDYYTEAGRKAAAQAVVDTPLFKGNPVVFMDLSKNGNDIGRVIFQLRKDVAPLTAENFRQFFTGECGRTYKGTTFHHILPANYAVGGNVPAESGRPEAAGGGFIPDENFGLLHSGAGVLSSASQIRDENGSMFFVTLNRAPNLNGRYVAFGTMMEGEDVLEKLSSSGDHAGNPTAEITITNCGELRLSPEAQAALPSAPAERN